MDNQILSRAILTRHSCGRPVAYADIAPQSGCDLIIRNAAHGESENFLKMSERRLL